MIVLDETKSDHVQNNDPSETPGGLVGLRSILKTTSACEVSLDDQNWSHPPLLYNVSGLSILPLLPWQQSEQDKVEHGSGKVRAEGCSIVKVVLICYVTELTLGFHLQTRL